MGKARIATGVFLVTLVTGAMGYTIASAVLTYQDLGFGAEIDFAYIAQNYMAILDRRPEDAQLIHLIIGSFAAAGLMLSLALSGSALTRFGQTHWQTAREMKANGFFGAPGTGFILGKLGTPSSRANYICSQVFPHALIVAPTGRGKTTGFVIPNLLTWQGSAVTLDVKGECFEATARHRAAQGDKVYRFAPTDWEGKRTHRYNPLLRIYQLKDPARQQMELQLLATLFLQSDNDRVQGLLKGGIDLFVAAGLLAFQRKRPTLGEIYRIAASGGNKQKEYFARGHEVDNRAAKLIFTRLASTNNDTLTSYVSLLMTSGLDQWQNPAIDEATAVSDFDFRTIRKKPFSVYLVVQPLMVKPLAPLIRLFFSDLLSAMQEKDPGPDEPWPVMIMLDEFNRLGKMLGKGLHRVERDRLRPGRGADIGVDQPVAQPAFHGGNGRAESHCDGLRRLAIDLHHPRESLELVDCVHRCLAMTPPASDSRDHAGQSPARAAVPAPSGRFGVVSCVATTRQRSRATRARHLFAWECPSSGTADRNPARTHLRDPKGPHPSVTKPEEHFHFLRVRTRFLAKPLSPHHGAQCRHVYRGS